MSLSRREKMFLHIYSGAAKLTDLEYRQVVKRNSGCRSAASPDFGQEGYEQSMAALETILFERVHAGLVPDPIEAGHRWIRSEYYWRHKLPKNGLLNSRQRHGIEELWKQLQPHLTPEKRTVKYFAAIVSKATGRADLGVIGLSRSEAWSVHEALKDRLKYAIRKEHAA